MVKLNDEKIVEYLEMIKPKMKKALLQTAPSNREDLEQDMILFAVKFLKEKEFENYDFFTSYEEDED